MLAERLKLFWALLGNQLWIRPALWSLLSVAAVAVALHFGNSLMPDGTPEVGVDMLSGMLTVIASTMLAICTFSLSVLYSVFSFVSTHASPRATPAIISVVARGTPRWEIQLPMQELFGGSGRIVRGTRGRSRPQTGLALLAPGCRRNSGPGGSAPFAAHGPRHGGLRRSIFSGAGVKRKPVKGTAKLCWAGKNACQDGFDPLETFPVPRWWNW